MKRLFGLLSFFAISAVLSGCAAQCPPTCLGENVGAVDWHGRGLQSANLVQSAARQANLDNVNFSGADLTGVNLSRASLSGTNLTGAGLIGANLADAFLTGAVFTNANLSGASFANADLAGVTLTSADLFAANFTGANLVNANLSGLNLAGSVLNEAKMAGVNFNEANLAGAQVSKSDLGGGSLRAADLRGAWINLTSLVSADLRSANLSGASLLGTDLTGANLVGANLVGANLIGVNLRGADLRGANLSLALLVATPGLVARENMTDPLLRNLSETQWKKLALSDTELAGARYDDRTRFPQDFQPTEKMIYQPGAGAIPVTTGRAGEKQLRVAGSANVAVIINPIARLYTAQNPQVTFDFVVTDSTDGLVRLGKGLADVAMSSRAPTQAELAAAPDLQAYRVANDSLVLVVNWNNPLTNLSTAQARAIYTGEIQNWQALGGPNLAVTPLRQNTTLLDVFQLLFMAGQALTDRAVSLPSNTAVRAEVAARAGAVGLLPGYLVDASVRPLAVDGVAWSSKTVQDRSYPLIRPYYLLTRGTPGADVQKLLALFSSAAGKDLIRLQGLEPVAP
jgi:uncharacterized protein YjbI with pentapeptide repeats/ABC-type phosphate transport system substrate-binding protein